MAFDHARPGFDPPQPKPPVDYTWVIILAALIIAVPPFGIGLLILFYLAGLWKSRKKP